jgi:putative DNA primase/helicase
LTGGDRIRARRMRENFFEFSPTHKLWVGVNSLPSLTEGGEAMRRRIRIIPFKNIIPVAERDPKLVDKLMAEAPGILSWAVRGCLAWQAEGLNPPQTLMVAVENYLHDADPLADFIGERCVVGAEQVTTSAALHSTYLDWCRVSGEQPLNRRDFASLLRARGFEPVRGTKGSRRWHGIGLAVAQSFGPTVTPMSN